MSFDPKHAVMDSLVGKPFMLLPGKPSEHEVLGETSEGFKMRAGGVQMVWNDMLFMDAIEGAGYYARMVRLRCRTIQRNLDFLKLAESLYGVSAADGLKHWMTLPNLARACEWPGERPS